MSRMGRGEDIGSQDGFFTIDLQMNDNKVELARKSYISGKKSVRFPNAGSTDNLSVRTSVISDNCPRNCQKFKYCHCSLI